MFMRAHAMVLPSVRRLENRMSDYDFRKADQSDLVQGVALAEHLTGLELASPDAILEMESITNHTIWVTAQPVEGIILSIPLTYTGMRAVRDGSYRPGAPNPEHLCAEGDWCYGLYVGVYAGATHAARKNIMNISATLRFEIFAEVPFFARGATPDGRRSMESLGFKPIEGGLKDLYVQEALVTARGVA